MIVQPFNADVADYYSRQLKTWLDFVEISKFKAFVELPVSDSVRQGTRNLLTVWGNNVCFINEKYILIVFAVKFFGSG